MPGRCFFFKPCKVMTICCVRTATLSFNFPKNDAEIIHFSQVFKQKTGRFREYEVKTSFKTEQNILK